MRVEPDVYCGGDGRRPPAGLYLVQARYGESFKLVEFDGATEIDAFSAIAWGPLDQTNLPQEFRERVETAYASGLTIPF